MFPAVQIKKTTFLRLSKILSLSSITSRSKAQELIKNGKVKVNNQIINKNVLTDVNSNIEINGIKINVDIRTKLWGIYKPKHVFCNTDKNYEYEEKEIANNNRMLNDNKMNYQNYEDKKYIKYLNDNNNRKISLIDSNCDKTLVIKSNSSTKNETEIRKNFDRNFLIEPNKRELLVSNNIRVSSNSKLNMNIFDFIRKKNILYEKKNKINNFIPDHLIIINSLDSHSEGLVLFTNDGDFAKNLRNVNNNILTTYLIKVQGELSQEKLKLLEKGCTIRNTRISPLSVEIIKSKFMSKWIKLTYVEKSKTDLDFLFSKYNLVIRKCKRFSFGPYKSSDLSEDFFMPLKVHSTINHLLPKYTSKLTLTEPDGNRITDSNEKYIYVKNYLQNTLIQNN
ncbi:RNA pseudouridylate synthase, putative [Plasmodium gallinaceum]|uniref:RNA pseudouridylate synthase, putative n=1 Tax=Plasmodium gallinaceum TaxID=5849 RepID=A0A1J1GMU8_PLAGA|nr:RNA pseudouridylate synthase, putative [Plasmodium gallinaceum]CRG93589.1 RNA pseudouridylate synthase, putative [Plasmodium gallinaceum]